MQLDFPMRSQGAEVLEEGVRYRTWAPGKTGVAVLVYNAAGAVGHRVELAAEVGGYFSGIDPLGSVGDRYKYFFDGSAWPDPASRFNPEGVHAAAQVIDPRAFVWHDKGWRCPALAEMIIYELHLGTFTPDGTFRAAMARLDHLAQLGVNAIEIMPMADFPGARNWGYDGVLPYAPARAYGSPDDFRALVDAAHAHGLGVILDVVYNHLGPDGNYLGAYSRDYFNSAHKTPWGDGFNFELPPVREFFLENPGYWRREFHIDGFRLDATHAIADSSRKHFLAEVGERIHSLGGFVMAEDERNEPQLLRPAARGGFGFDAKWSDDFHHVVRVMLTREREGYYRPYAGTTDELVETLRDGWLLRGKKRQRKLAGEASECTGLPPEKFVFCIANHDQIGNQALGMRLSEKISASAYRAASALLCLVPYTPLLFMGQEWAATTPFQFFTDHGGELGRRVTEGRREEFRDFSLFRDPGAREKIPDPQDEATFLRSKLCWEEIAHPQHAAMLRLYTELLRLRRGLSPLRNRARENWEVGRQDSGTLRLIFGHAGRERCLVVADFVRGKNESPENGWELVLSTNDKRFVGGEEAAFDAETCLYRSVHD